MLTGYAPNLDVMWRVTGAVETMCVGKGDVRSRLLAAVGDHLLPLREEDFPVALGPKFRRSGKSHADLEGLLGATMRRIRRDTGAKMGEEVWSLYEELLVEGSRLAHGRRTDTAVTDISISGTCTGPGVPIGRTRGSFCEHVGITTDPKPRDPVEAWLG